MILDLHFASAKSILFHGISREILFSSHFAKIFVTAQVNPAVWEISGHIVLKRREDYDLATEDYAWKLLAEVSLSHDRFEEVKAACLKATFGDANTGGACNQKEKCKEHENLCSHKTASLDAVVPNPGGGLSVEG